MLLQLLHKARIWGLNIGETKADDGMWLQLLHVLPATSVSFMYASESLREGMKEKFRDAIRKNRM